MNFGFSFYPWFKLGVWLLLAFWVSRKIKPQWAFGFLAVYGTTQALIGLGQFFLQQDLGLQFLGESILSPLNRDVARTFIEGGRLLRAYGTFPHPNILAAFLVLSLLSLYYFFIVTGRFNFLKLRNTWEVELICLIFINWLGLLLTFSRAGWLIGVLSTVFFLSWRCFNNFAIAELLKLIFVSFLIIFILILIFHWAVFPRAEFYDYFSIQNRLSDYQYAWQKIKDKPFFGHGLTLAMGERPIHNLYFTIAVEVGLVGLSLFLIFIFYALILNLKFVIQNFSLEKSTLLVMFIALLALGLFDHFLWTLRPGLAMFWLVVGLLLSVHGSTDRTQASEA